MQRVHNRFYGGQPNISYNADCFSNDLLIVALIIWSCCLTYPLFSVVMRATVMSCRKPTHTDQYLAYDSYHPQSVKRYCQVSTWSSQTDHQQTIRNNSGEKTSIHSSRRQRLPSVLLTESDQNQELNTRKGNSRIQVYRSAAIHLKSLRTPPPPPTATRNMHRL